MSKNLSGEIRECVALLRDLDANARAAPWFEMESVDAPDYSKACVAPSCEPTDAGPIDDGVVLENAERSNVQLCIALRNTLPAQLGLMRALADEFWLDARTHPKTEAAIRALCVAVRMALQITLTAESGGD